MTPEDWKKGTVGQYVDLLSGYAFKSDRYCEDETGTKLLRGDNISQGKLRWRSAKFWPENLHEEKLQRFMLDAGDFVVAMDRTWIPAGVKISEVTEADLPCLLVQRVARLRTGEGLEQRLLKQIFGGHHFEQYVKKVQTETAVPHISPLDIKEFPILVPPLPEQERIADVLTTWDHAIENTEKLIENCMAQKKGLMQHLLTSRKRLDGFDGAWQRRLLGELGTFKKGKGISRGDVVQSGLPAIRYGEIYTKHHFLIEDFISFIEPDVAKQSEKLVRGDILFTCSGETAEEIGKCVAYLGDEQAYAGGDIILLRAHGQSAEFLGYALNSAPIVRQKMRFGQGHSVVHISAEHLANIAIDLPPLDEQRAIAKVISTAHSQIKKWQQLLAQLRSEKAALMQQLLTGKRRVKLDGGV